MVTREIPEGLKEAFAQQVVELSDRIACYGDTGCREYKRNHCTEAYYADCTLSALVDIEVDTWLDNIHERFDLEIKWVNVHDAKVCFCDTDEERVLSGPEMRELQDIILNY